ncbi:hypothetical protein [Streptomyces sp. NPDC054962]
MAQTERAARTFTRALLEGSGALDERSYDTARTTLGERSLFELSTLVGYYRTPALRLRHFDVPAWR